MSSCYGSTYRRSISPEKCAQIKAEIKKAELEAQKAKLEKEQEMQR